MNDAQGNKNKKSGGDDKLPSRAEFDRLLARVRTLETRTSQAQRDGKQATDPMREVFIVRRDTSEPKKWKEQAFDESGKLVDVESGRSAEAGEVGEMLDFTDMDGAENCCAAVEVTCGKAGQVVRRFVPITPATVFFPVQITGATAIPDATNRWSYAWVEMRPVKIGVYELKPGGRTSADIGGGKTAPGYNTLEANNSDTGTQGNGVNMDDMPDDAVFQSVPTNGSVVEWAIMIRNCDGNMELHFTYPNVVKTQCPPPPGGD